MSDRKLPAGNVTVLFTDVEGSTRLIDDLGEQGYVRALVEHRRLLRAAFGAHAGVEVDTQGDAFLCAFADPVEALAAAVEGQEALACSEVKVRMGLHTGELQLTGEGYAGRELHRAARIAASGHGGQIVLSGATRALVGGDLIELGEHRLKDFAEPVALFQLGDTAFPPLKTISNTNLPRPASSFVGREREVAEVISQIHGGARLMTLTGPGGSGKTRLAIEAASELIGEFKAGVFWVGLATLRDPSLVLETIAQTLGAKSALPAEVGERELMLVLDNLEQVIEAAPELASLVEACPKLVLLMTSRERLRVRGESEYAVLPLADSEAVELFWLRSGVDPSDDVSELCRRLDNMPLAVELAAARASVLTVNQILERLTQRLDLFRGGRDADPRQHTLRATIEWSHDLLSPEDQRLFARLAVFAGGCTLEAAEHVCEADLDSVQSLVEKSLLRRTNDRFWMLETIRGFALERLAASEGTFDRCRRAAGYFLDLAESAGLTVEAIEAGKQQRHDLAHADLDNFRAVLDWALETDAEVGLRVAVALEQLWVTLDPREGVRRYEALLQRASVLTLPLELRARAIRAMGGALQIAGENSASLRCFEESLELFRSLGNESAVLHMELRIANSLSLEGETDQARNLFEEGIARARAIGSQFLETQALGQLGYLEHHAGNLVRAVDLLARSVELAHALDFLWFEGGTLDELAGCALELGRPDEAEEYARRAISVARQIEDRRLLVYALGRLAGVAAARGDGARAGRFWGAVEAEEGRGTFGIWAGERESLARPLELVQGPTFDHGRNQGRLLSLEESVDAALSDFSTS
jgi:predicted ATPase